MTSPHWVRVRTVVLVIALGVVAVAAVRARRPSATGPLPRPAQDEPLATAGSARSMVVAGGCFWGVQAVFQHVLGVTSAVSGYAGGSAATATYGSVGTRLTAHAESVQVTYDASVITYGQLLQIFFAVAHDPTELNRQGPDVGPEYRSAIFYANAEQQRVARAYIAQLTKAGVFRGAIVTEVTALPAFYRAEAYHQNYATLNPTDGYIVFNDAPKVVNLQAVFPALYRATPVLVK